MTIVQPARADRFVREPPAETRAILLYGPDAGLVGERAKTAASAFTEGSDDPFAIARIEAADIQADPARIADEATSMALFGGQRAIRVRPESQDIAATLSGLVERIAADSLIIVEAGNLAPTSRLRKLFETTASFAAVPCYADTERDLETLIDDELGARKMRIDADARAFLIDHLGGDRRASRMELEKLCLYAGPGGRVALEDVAAIVGDVSALELDQALDAAGLGEAASLDRAVQRLLAAGGQPAQLVSAAIRHFLTLHALRAETDAGTSARAVIDKAKPPIFFKRREAVTRQLESWSRADIEQALDRLREAERWSRLGDALAAPAVAQTLIDICVSARR
jgi:DNA polymerase-3 subunit delta